MFFRKIAVFLFCVLLNAQALAQTALNTNDKNNISSERREKSLNLLKALGRESEQFSLPFNRVSARIVVADLLWNSDEKTARAIFQNAIADISLMLGQIPPENADADDEYNTERYKTLADIKSVRNDLLLALAERDPKFALDTFQFLIVRDAEGKSVFDEDATLELDLAAKITASDPKKAYELAKKNLENNLGGNLFSTLENLYDKDAELGARLAQDILTKIKRKDTIISSPSDIAANATVSNTNMSKPNASNTAYTVNLWEIQNFFEAVQKLNRKAAKDKKSPLLSENDIKELVDVMAQRYLRQEYLSSYEVAKIMPEITKNFPAQAAAIRRKLGQQESATLNNLIKTQNFQNETENLSADEILRLIEKKPVAEREDLYYQAAEKAFGSGDIEQAKKFHSRIKTKREYDYLDKGIDDALPLALAEKGDSREARHALAKLKTPEEKIEVLSALAKTSARTNDMKAAASYINEARSIYSGKMKNRKNLNSVLSLARAYAVIEPEQSFSLLESNLPFFNEIINAAAMLDEFNDYGAVENDELRLDTVRSESYRNAPKGVELIKNLTAADFERTVSLADRFARPEARFYARFRIAEALLDPSAEDNEKEIIKTLENAEGDY